MTADAGRVAGLAAVTLALGLLVAVLGESIFRRGGGDEGAIVGRLKRLERDGFDVPAAGGALRASKVSFQRISVTLDAAGELAEVTSTLDFVGQIARPAGPPTRVSSLGLERARYVKRGGEWAPETIDAPRLVAIVDALEARRSQLERGAQLADGGVPWADVLVPRVFRSEAWFIRSERGEVEVAEDSRLIGTAADRPVDTRATRRFTLLEADGGSFSFPDGIL